jgi:uncharacterized membrane protein
VETRPTMPFETQFPFASPPSLSTIGLRRVSPKNGMTPLAPTRRWTVIASGLLCGLLAVIVLFTERRAFHSPMALVVVAAIGLAAVLLQLRMRNRDQAVAVHPPVWLNVVGIVLALAALFADVLRLSSPVTQLLALGAIGSFAISSAVILHAFRKQRAVQK